MGLRVALPTTVTYNHVVCGVCQIPFYMPDTKYEKCLDEHKEFWCPNGHQLWFTNSKVKQLEAELAREKKSKEWVLQDLTNVRKQRDREERKARAFKGVITKVKRRVGAGVCPCCNRYFAKLHAHMDTKHPKYKNVVVKPHKTR